MKYFICFLILIALSSCETDYKGENSLRSDYRLKMEKLDSMARYYGFSTDHNIYEYNEFNDTTSLQHAKMFFEYVAKEKLISRIMYHKKDSIEKVAIKSYQQSKQEIPQGKFIVNVWDQNEDILEAYTFEELKEIASKYPELEAKNIKK